MLNPFKRHRVATVVHTTRADLQIRSLLDNPELRRVMGLDTEAPIKAEHRDDARRPFEAAAA